MVAWRSSNTDTRRTQLLGKGFGVQGLGFRGSESRIAAPTRAAQGDGNGCPARLQPFTPAVAADALGQTLTSLTHGLCLVTELLARNATAGGDLQNALLAALVFVIDRSHHPAVFQQHVRVCADCHSRPGQHQVLLHDVRVSACDPRHQKT